MKNRQGLRLARYLLQGQLGITVLIALLVVIFLGIQAFISAILGGLIAIIPAVFFARIMFRYYGAQQTRQIARSFYMGEAIKLVLTVILFALVFIFCKIMPLVFFGTYILAQLIMWLVPWLVEKSPGLKLKSDKYGLKYRVH